MELLAFNNTPFRWSADVSAWAGAYTLSTAEWVMTIRRTAASNDVVLAMTTTGGGALFAANVVTFLADIAAVDNLADAYAFDFGFVPVLGGEFIRVSGGQIDFAQGVSFP